jgi:hypothetical protein
MSDLLGKVEHGKDVTVFPDLCSGQNRNINMCAMFLHAVRTLGIPTTNHSFHFQPGHSQKEVDSMHANNEKQSMHVRVFGPVLTYVTSKSQCNRDGRLICFLNFTEFQKQVRKNKKVDIYGETMNFLRIV